MQLASPIESEILAEEMRSIWLHVRIVLDILSMQVLVWALARVFASAVDCNGGILDSHLFFYDRYTDLADYHRARGRTARAEKLAGIAEAYYQAAPDDDDEPQAAAMALPVPRSRLNTNAVSTHRLGALVTTLTLLMWTPATAQNPAPPAPAPRSNASAVQIGKPGQYPGLPRFGVVSTQLYRGGQPENRGFAELKGLGIDLVVNLRNEPDEIRRERALVEGQGLRYASIPWRGKENPKLEQVAEFLDLLRANVGKKVFVHCERGSERTGVMVAVYRMSAERWSPDQALAEMAAFGFRRFGFGHLRQFVREFPALLTRDPLLSKSSLEK